MVLTCELSTTTAFRKVNCVDVADKLSPFKFYQHLLTNVADTEVVKFLKMLTFLPLAEIAEIEVRSCAYQTP